MKTIPMFFLLAVLFFNAKGQSLEDLRRDCDFLNHLHFKNGVDTVIVVGYKTGLVRIGPPLKSLTELIKQKKIKQYKNRFGITFKPVNCAEEFVVDCIDASPFAFKMQGDDEDTPVKLRCLIFDGYREFGKQYFIVDKIMPFLPK